MWWPSLILASLLGPLVTSALPQGGRSQVLKEIFFFLFIYIHILSCSWGYRWFRVVRKNFRVIWEDGSTDKFWEIDRLVFGRFQSLVFLDYLGLSLPHFWLNRFKSLTFLEGSLVLVDKPSKLKVSSECSS